MSHEYDEDRADFLSDCEESERWYPEEPTCGNCAHACFHHGANGRGWCIEDDKWVRSHWKVVEWWGEDATCWRSR